jgi:hypothetical protein
LSRSGALPVKGLELVVEKCRLCGDLSPASALGDPAKDPARCCGDPRPARSIATIYSPFAGTNFLERHYVKALKNSAGYRWVNQK